MLTARNRRGERRGWRSLFALAFLPVLVVGLADIHLDPQGAAHQPLAAAGQPALAGSPQAADAPQVGSARAAKSESRDCAACLHRLQVGGAHLSAPAGLPTLASVIRTLADLDLDLSRSPLSGASPRGPPVSLV